MSSKVDQSRIDALRAISDDEVVSLAVENFETFMRQNVARIRAAAIESIDFDSELHSSTVFVFSVNRTVKARTTGNMTPIGCIPVSSSRKCQKKAK